MLNELVKEIHENAVQHGWWDEERTTGEIIALCHSELSEALEEYRNSKPMVYVVGDNGEIITDEEKFNNRKPEGIAIELVDCVIRILDYCGKEKFNIDEAIRQADFYNYISIDKAFGDFLAECNGWLSSSYRGHSILLNAYFLGCCCYEIQKYLEDCYLDMDVLIKMKHDYNKTRPYKHGGKVI